MALRSSGGNHFLLILINIVISISSIVSFDCPILQSFANETGILIFNKTSAIRNEPKTHCQWLIVGSLYKRIVVEFDYVYIPVPIDEYLRKDCHRGSINLWTPGLEKEKIEICGDRHRIRVAGVGHTLMVELVINNSELHTKFLMHYRLIPIEQALSTPSHLIKQPILSREHYGECGLTSIDIYRSFREVSSRIVGGRQVIPHSRPWQVLLNNHGKFCGATVLNTNWIVTAAHCVNGSDPTHISAEFGMHDRYVQEASRITRTIRRIVVYPAYSGKSTRWLHDIALLQLSESISFSPFIRSICLSPAQDIVRIGDQTIVTGWGETQGTGNFRYLREVEVPIQSSEQCRLNNNSWNTTLCAGLCMNSTCDSCQGDSGGPMIFLRNGRWHLVGLISWGFSCSGLGVYTKVSYYADWIAKIIYYTK